MYYLFFVQTKLSARQQAQIHESFTVFNQPFQSPDSESRAAQKIWGTRGKILVSGPNFPAKKETEIAYDY